MVGNDKIRKIGIGKYTSLSWKCTIGAPVHPFSTITNCTLMYKKYKVVHIEDSLSQKRTMVGNDAWTGCVVTAIDGVHIGNGAITGVGSVVTECIPDYQIWAEISAKK